MRVGLTFDDVLLVPKKSFHDPTQVSTEIKLSPKIQLQIPIISSAMDTVTGKTLASALAREGGLGIIHKNLTIEKQVHKVNWVKELIGQEVLVDGTMVRINGIGNPKTNEWFYPLKDIKKYQEWLEDNKDKLSVSILMHER